MKLDNRQTITVGLAFLSICAFWQVYDGIIPLILKNTFQIGDTASGVVMALDNILALVLLPLFGTLSDKTHTRLGRRMPFILAGTLAACVSILLVPLADRLVSLPLFFVALALALVSMSSYRSPAVALMPDVTPKPLRSKGNAIINLMGTLGGIMMLVAIKLLVSKTDRPDYFGLFALTAILMAVCVGWLYFHLNEPQAARRAQEQDKPSSHTCPVQHKSGPMPAPVFRSLCFLLASVAFWFMGYNAVTTAFSKYAAARWGMLGGDYAMVLMVAQAAAVVAYLPVGIIASRAGRKKTILAGICMLAVAFFAGALFQEFSFFLFVFFALAGIGWAFINVNSYPMVVEMSQDADVGKYTGYYYTFSMSAQIITPILSGAVMEYWGYQYLFPYATFFVALSFFTMLLVRHGDSRPIPKKGLEALDTED